MKMEMIINDAVEFVFALRRFADRNKSFEPEYPGIPEIAEWCSEGEKTMSPFLLNDISLIIEKTILVSVFLFLLAHENEEIETVDDFLAALTDLSPENFKDRIFTEIFDSAEEEITREKIYKVLIDDGLHPGYDPGEEADLLVGFLKQPGDFMIRLHRTCSDFYKQVYMPGRRKLDAIYREKFEWHKNRLSEGNEKYLQQLGLSSFIKENFGSDEPVIYYSFFADNETSTFWKAKTVVIGGGTDQRILHYSARNKADTFFSCFGDPKRLEILRLTAIRPWYSTELAEYFDVKPATLSYHMNKLVEAELLHIQNGEARRFYYTLNKEKLSDYLDYVSKDLLGLDYAKDQ